MSNAMKYIKDLEAAGFERNQAEAQVQVVLDAIEGDLVTKSDFAAFKEQIETRFENRFSQFTQKIESQFAYFTQKIENQISQLESRINKKILESEFRTTTRLGFLFATGLTVAVATLAWIIKI
jgi:hypothetical protein